jgi:P pilus assembly chaperone PapD
MSRLTARACVFSVFSLLIFIPLFSFGGSIDVVPSVIKLAGHQSGSSTQIRNSMSAEASFEIKVVEEIGVGADMQRVPSSDLVVSPPIFTVKAGERQTVRFSLKRPNNSLSEVRYRLVVEQLPGPAAADEPGLRMLMNLLIPVFVAPSVEHVSLAKATVAGGYSLKNTGNVTVQILGLEAPACDDVKFNRYLRPAVAVEVPLTAVQKNSCRYQARLDSGLHPLD